jgi:hypothetical protein
MDVWKDIARFLSFMNLLFGVLAVYFLNIHYSSYLRFSLLTSDLSIHEFFDFEITSGYEYTNRDWDMGQVLYYEGDITCIYYSLKVFNYEVFGVTRENFFYEVPGHVKNDEDSHTKLDTIRSQSSNRTAECFDILELDIEKFLTQRLNLQEGDTIKLKYPDRWPWLLGMRLKLHVIMTIAQTLLSFILSTLLFILPFIYEEKTKLLKNILLTVGIGMTIQYILTLLLPTLSLGLTRNLYDCLHRAPRIGVEVDHDSMCNASMSQIGGIVLCFTINIFMMMLLVIVLIEVNRL